MQAIIDEQTDEYVDRYKEASTSLRSLKPDIQPLEATMTVNLSGMVNDTLVLPGLACPSGMAFEIPADTGDED